MKYICHPELRNEIRAKASKNSRAQEGRMQGDQGRGDREVKGLAARGGGRYGGAGAWGLLCSCGIQVPFS